jgi:3-dehydroquinate synthase
VSNRVAVNWNGLKNRVGAFHEPVHTIIDPTFLKSLPEAEIRNGLAEILKITSCTHLEIFELIEQHGQALIQTRFAQVGQVSADLSTVADKVIRQGAYGSLNSARRWTDISNTVAIQCVLDVELPNSREQNLNRVMYFGHTWSPVLELAVKPLLLHGHAVAIDICFSVTLAKMLGRISNATQSRVFGLFSRLGLGLDHPDFTLELMKKGTKATIATRDQLLRAPIPTKDLGTYEILPLVDEQILENAWREHKKEMTLYPRNGVGIEMTIDVRQDNFEFNGI